MAGLGSGTAGGRGHLRASHADRERVIGTLKAAFVQGMLTRNELDLRVGQALASRTYAGLAALTADLPAGVAAAPAPRTCAPGSQVPGKAVRAALCAALAVVLLALAAFLGPERLIGVAVFFVPLCGLSTGGLVLLHSWLNKHSPGQLPQGPPSGPDTQGSQRAAPVTGP